MPGRSGENLSIGIFLTYLVPADASVPCLSREWFTLLGLQDSLWALVVVYPTFTHPVLHLAAYGLLQVGCRGEIEEGRNRRRLHCRGSIRENRSFLFRCLPF